jgi:hypothetical protein
VSVKTRTRGGGGGEGGEGGRGQSTRAKGAKAGRTGRELLQQSAGGEAGSEMDRMGPRWHEPVHRSPPTDSLREIEFKRSLIHRSISSRRRRRCNRVTAGTQPPLMNHVPLRRPGVTCTLRDAKPPNHSAATAPPPPAGTAPPPLASSSTPE